MGGVVGEPEEAHRRRAARIKQDFQPLHKKHNAHTEPELPTLRLLSCPQPFSVLILRSFRLDTDALH